MVFFLIASYWLHLQATRVASGQSLRLLGWNCDERLDRRAVPFSCHGQTLAAAILLLARRYARLLPGSTLDLRPPSSGSSVSPSFFILTFFLARSPDARYLGG